MSVKLPKKRIRRIFGKGGFSYVILTVLMFLALFIDVAVFEIIRLNIQAAAVRDKFEDAIISMCVENYARMYQPIRESNAASYGYNGSRWIENSKANETYIRNYLNSAMSSGEIMQCTINSVDFSVKTADLAPSDVDSAEKYSVSGTIKVTVPYRFAWSDLVPITLSLDVKSVWRAKF